MPTDLDLRREVAEARGWTSIHKSDMRRELRLRIPPTFAEQPLEGGGNETD